MNKQTNENDSFENLDSVAREINQQIFSQSLLKTSNDTLFINIKLH